MSLSRVVKKPGNIVFNEIVQLKDKSFVSAKSKEHSSEPDYQVSQQIILDAQEEALRMINEAQETINLMRAQFDKECHEKALIIKEEAYSQAYQDGMMSYKADALLQIESINDKLIELEKKREELLLRQFEEIENKIYTISLDVASKILRVKIDTDDSILKTLVLDELNSRKSQNIQLVEVSQKAQSLIYELENELELKGIVLQTANEDSDHIVIKGEIGDYDLSIRTQIKNIKRLFNTL